jgi:hypothetical protein
MPHAFLFYLNNLLGLYSYSRLRLPPQCIHQEKEYFAIYGATNKIGKAFSQFACLKNFGLILIDSSLERLEKLESDLSKAFPTKNIRFHPLFLNNKIYPLF